MKDKTENATQAEKPKPIPLPRGLDVIGAILNPTQPLTPKSYPSPRDKQFRGGKNKGL